ncbi:phenylalanyl-tRNA synthetase subunit beta [Spiroplasma sabaudiense Ar-1343]|uniref:Phenylalanine--tRNA ligase beta subunit n=1 Tax=Spiroplasma sabaudiense Ar-1343 TaxID=1276257 RepID=W6AAC6_9MOLU|nr:phenylalanine--tRNA ligase subunit beta [Spiroplasma sabaudiense]AHI54012.1 phenylalanyl-tRNA synthetase subunit beta [Spiroplasma sabaudiense Ar-1343]
MIITRNWLEKYIDLKGIQNSQISIALNSLGFEVEEENDYSKLNDDLVLGHIGFCEKIQGTHLNSTFVDTGTELPHLILCGAGNVAEGQFVITALPGMKIANGLTINKREIQGKTSEGMICSLEEIGLKKELQTPKELDGIYEIHAKEDLYKLSGSPILKTIGFLDYTWEVDLTLNRSDALSAFQIGKEIANYFKRDFNLGFNDQLEAKTFKHNIDVKISQELSEDINMIAYTAVETKKIYSLKDENLFLYSSDELIAKFSGIKKEENFFEDIANLIAFESGQPVVILDANKVTENLTIVNSGTSKDPQVEIKMGDKLVSVLGKGIEKDFLPKERSKELIILYFNINPILMRRQQKKLNMSNCALQRYMKPMSLNIINQAWETTINWLLKYDFIESFQPLKFIKQTQQETQKILLPAKRIREYLGFSLNLKRLQKLFSHLDFEIKITGEKNNIFEFTCDPKRLDLNFEADIIEEIARLFGYDNIKPIAPSIVMTGKAKDLSRTVQSKIGNYLIGAGFTNIKTYSLIKEEDAKKWDLFKIDYPIQLMSPISKNHEFYRQSLFKSFIDVIETNSNKGNKNTKFYEIADVYNLQNVRQRHLALSLTGDFIDDKISKIKIPGSFDYLKSVTENILKVMNVNLEQVSFEQNETVVNEIHPFISSKIMLNGSLIGFLFKLNPRKEQALKVTSVFLMELNLTQIEKQSQGIIELKPISKFQKTTRDVSFEINADLNLGNYFKKITQNLENLIDYKVIDVYEDEVLKANNAKAIAMNFTFNSFDKQLSDQEVGEEFDKILNNISGLGFKVR